MAGRFYVLIKLVSAWYISYPFLLISLGKSGRQQVFLPRTFARDLRM